MTKNKWGLPDWRDEAAYVPPDNAHIFYWKWQFTRRRKDYRAAWAEAWERKDAAAKERWPDTAPHPDSNKYGMFHLVNPALAEYPMGTFQPLPGTAEVYTEEFDAFRERRDGGLVSIEFDLTKPLKEQLERANEALAFEAQSYCVRERRYRPTLWQLYLRALDARDVPESDVPTSYAIMAQTFWPRLYSNEGSAQKTLHSARDTYDAAVALRDNFPA